MKKALLTLAALLSLTAAAQPVLAAEPVGQMIDDTGLVISSYNDGSVKEFRLVEPVMITLKILTNSSKTATILETAAKSTVSKL